MLFTETTTIGVRYQEMLRERLEREIRRVDDARRRDPVQGRAAARPRS